MPARGRPVASADPAKPRRQASQAAAQEEAQGISSVADDGAVGLSPDPPDVKESEPETDTYICGRCRGPVEHHQERCETCGDRLNWS